ncbi:MAG TPA: tyrosine-type recombinase/integrase [Methanolinea sp.]|nr:tyrosine-type recombinase/integrase [Methanolinea sp.]
MQPTPTPKVKPISLFLNGYAKKRSQSIYLLGIKAFLEWKFNEKCSNGKEIALDRMESLATRYFTEPHDPTLDLTQYTAHLAGHYAPTSRRVYFSTIKQYFIFNEVEFKAHQERQFSRKLPKGYSPRTKEDNLTIDLTRKLCDNASPRLKAFILVLLSSGMRMGEALMLEEDDVFFDEDPVRVELRDTYTKTGESRTCYISKEAADAVKLWLAQRADYLRYKVKVTANIYRKDGELVDDGKIFAMSRQTAIRQFNDCLLRAGYCKRDSSGEKTPVKDKQTGRSPIHLHQYRKVFRTVMAGGKSQRGNSLDIVENLLGHSGYLTKSYVRLTDEEIRDFYRQNEHLLYIHTPVMVESVDTKRLQEIEEELARLKEENAALRIAQMSVQYQTFLKVVQDESKMNKLLELAAKL